MMADRQHIVDRKAQGWTYRQIATELTQMRGYAISHATVAKDYHKALEEYRSSIATNIEEARVRELTRLDKLEREAWDTFERSRRDHEKVVTKEGSDAKQGSYHEIVKELEKRDGESRLLELILKVHQSRARMLGINEAAKVQVTHMSYQDEVVEQLRRGLMTVEDAFLLFPMNAADMVRRAGLALPESSEIIEGEYAD